MNRFGRTLLVGLLAFEATQGKAQTLTGTVSTGGTPIPEAVVSAWDSMAERARALTNARGGFEINIPARTNLRWISVRAIGYMPTTVAIEPGTTEIVINLDRFAVPLPELVASALKVKCPSPQDGQALGLIQALVARYQLISANVGVAARVRQSTGTVDGLNVGRFDEPRLVPTIRGISGLLRGAAQRAMERGEYAIRLTNTPGDLLTSTAAVDDLYSGWWYPALESWDSDQWLRSEFLRSHTFSYIGPKGSPGIVQFCAVDRSRPGIDGALRISSDTALRAADWNFITPSPREHAGGRAEFVGIEKGRRPQLLPSLGLFWREMRGREGIYVQRVVLFQSIVFGETAEIPQDSLIDKN